MTDAPLSEQTMLASLQDIRLPTEAAGGMVAEVLASVALGGLAALACVALGRLVSVRKVQAREPSMAEQKQALALLPPDDRRLALLRLLKTHAPERFAALSGQLYAPGALPLDTLQAEVDRLV